MSRETATEPSAIEEEPESCPAHDPSTSAEDLAAAGFDHKLKKQVGLDEMAWLDDYDECFEVLRDPRFEVAHSNRGGYAMVGGSMQVQDGPIHIAKRREMLPLMSHGAISRYEFEIGAPALRESLDKLCSEASANGDVARTEMMELMDRPVTLIVQALIGTDKGGVRLRELGEAIGEATLVDFSTRDRQTVIQEGLDANEEFVEDFFRPSLERREKLVADWKAGKIAEEELPVDLLTLLAKSDLWSRDDEDTMVKEALFFMGAAFGSTLNALPKVFLELSEWLEKHPEDHETMVYDSAFLQDAVGEALRLHPPAPFVIRYAREALTLSTGREVEEGECLVIDLTASGRDPSVYGEDAEEFDPRRNKAGGRIQQYAVSFGLGPHTCLAKPAIIGKGRGSIVSGEEPAGFLNRLMQVLLEYNVVLDPDNAPKRRDNTKIPEWESMPLIVKGIA